MNDDERRRSTDSIEDRLTKLEVSNAEIKGMIHEINSKLDIVTEQRSVCLQECRGMWMRHDQILFGISPEGGLVAELKTLNGIVRERKIVFTLIWGAIGILSGAIIDLFRRHP